MLVRSVGLALSTILLLAPIAAADDDESYDEAGRLVSSTDQDGLISFYQYNEEGVLVITRRSDGSVIVHGPAGEVENE